MEMRSGEVENVNKRCLIPGFNDLQIKAYCDPFLCKEWLGNKLKPTDWGWIKGTDGDLHPLTTLNQPAPTAILSTIFCSCTKCCGARCGCRKAGISCSSDEDENATYEDDLKSIHSI
ncbi:hypothetical protein NQ317_017897 [Molorchus minor]|uniref:Uncharacterized protein n=1 Tax=Molorchus minor TaxID=1323400 RepID=A0ABQ9IXX2_9CUCU|nr:hypothetical protein NQ317_017897 [Molorchus minor]